MEKFLRIAEFYSSIQGEGLHSGLACYFIRTAGCDLRCRWCDTPGALEATSGRWYTLSDILDQVPLHIPLIQLTGGEPLLQRENLIALASTLHEHPWKKKILLETGGHHRIDGLPTFMHIVMDIKLRGSGEDKHDFERNFSHLKFTDEIKFVISSRDDFDTALQWISKYHLSDICSLLVSPVLDEVKPADLVRWVMETHAPVRMQLQLHKIIWGVGAQGV